MAQFLQFEQLQITDLPALFFLTILTMIAVTTAIRTAQMTNVQMLSEIHVNKTSSPILKKPII